jgi:hypothetical protein
MRVTEIVILSVCAVAAMCVAVDAQSTTCVAPFQPYQNVSHMDHNDDHDGYTLNIRVLTPLPCTTECQIAQALDAFLYQMTQKDDIIIFDAFFDTTNGVWVVSETWRTTAGAAASFAFASSIVNLNLWLTQTVLYQGIIDDFLELEEIHSISEQALYHSVRVSTLSNPVTFNVTLASQLINQYVLTQFANLGYPISALGGVDYTSTYPTAPAANTYWLTESTYYNATTLAYGEQYLQPTINQYLNGFFTNDFFYQGVVQVFWHSAPGVTAAVPNPPTIPSTPPATCSSGASQLTQSVSVLIAATAVATGLSRF